DLFPRVPRTAALVSRDPGLGPDIAQPPAGSSHPRAGARNALRARTHYARAIRTEGSRVGEIQLYGASWCPDCRRAKKFLADQRVPFDWHDIDGDEEGIRLVEDRNGGK